MNAYERMHLKFFGLIRGNTIQKVTKSFDTNQIDDYLILKIYFSIIQTYNNFL